MICCNMLLWLLLQAALQNTNLALDVLDCVLRFSIWRDRSRTELSSGITSASDICVTHSNLSTQPENTHRRTWRCSVSIRNHTRNQQRIEQHTDNACLENNCCSLCFRCAVSTQQIGIVSGTVIVGMVSSFTLDQC